MWIWETLKQLSDKYLRTRTESEINLVDAMKWRVKPTKSPEVMQLKYICTRHVLIWKRYKKGGCFSHSHCPASQERQKLAFPEF